MIAPVISVNRRPRKNAPHYTASLVNGAAKATERLASKLTIMDSYTMDKHTMIGRNLHRQVQVAISSKICVGALT